MACAQQALAAVNMLENANERLRQWAIPVFEGTIEGWAQVLQSRAAYGRIAACCNLRRSISKDMRYYDERVRTAQLISVPTSNEVIAFDHTVTLEGSCGRTQTFRIVGEDEANPSQASISYGSPTAVALIGKTVRDVVQLEQRELEILSIS